MYHLIATVSSFFFFFFLKLSHLIMFIIPTKPIISHVSRLVKDVGRGTLWKWVRNFVFVTNRPLKQWRSDKRYFDCRKVHKYGKSTTGESWDIVVDEETYYE